jgi:hypothetical protein
LHPSRCIFKCHILPIVAHGKPQKIQK